MEPSTSNKEWKKPLTKQDRERPLTEQELLFHAEHFGDLLFDEDDIPLDNSFQTDEEDIDEGDIGDEEITIEPRDEPISTTNNTFEDLSDQENMENIPINQNEENRHWKKREQLFTIPHYVYDEGPVCEEFATCKTATDIFLRFLQPLLDDIVYQSNLYAVQRNKTLNLKKDELLAFIGINQFMGYHKLPSWRHYWSTSKDLEVPLVAQTMSRDRFDSILSNLHVNDNTAIPNNNKDKLFKLRPMLSQLNCVFENLYRGTRMLSVDESMIAFKGRSSIKQYNPMKPIKRGYKIWCLADQKGYIIRFDVYQGKETVDLGPHKQYGLGERVVLKLTEKEWGKHRMIYFDNFFTSIPLLEKLKVENVFACGTIRQNRKGGPKNLAKDKDLKRGEYDYRFSSLDIGYFKWKDNKVVTFASNFHGNQTTHVKRKLKDGTSISIPCPDIVSDYNKYMGGVDHADQLRSTYGLGRRSKKWWHRIFWGLLDITFVNSYIVYCQMFDKVTLLEYRRSVALGLMNKNNPRTPLKRRKTNYSIPIDARLSNRGNHWVKYVEERGRCEVCSRKKIQSRPHSKCSVCNVFLCCNEKKNCFSEFHEIQF